MVKKLNFFHHFLYFYKRISQFLVTFGIYKLHLSEKYTINYIFRVKLSRYTTFLVFLCGKGLTFMAGGAFLGILRRTLQHPQPRYFSSHMQNFRAFQPLPKIHWVAASEKISIEETIHRHIFRVKSTKILRRFGQNFLRNINLFSINVVFI